MMTAPAIRPEYDTQTNRGLNMSNNSIVLPEEAAASPSVARFKGRSLFMMACCLAMAGGTVLLMASAPSGTSWADRFWLAAPLLGCVGMHLVMHRFMGRCAMSGKSQGDQNNA